MPVYAILISSLMLLSACSMVTLTETSTQESPAITGEVTDSSVTKTIETTKTTRPFPADTLYDLLVAEFAVNRREANIAVDNYVTQAEATQDTAVISQAARIAQLFRHYPNAVRMGSLWLDKEPNSLEALAIITSAHIELRQLEKALDSAEHILGIIDANDERSIQQSAIVEIIANRSQGQTPEVYTRLIKRYQQLSEQYTLYPAITVGLSKLYEFSGNYTAAKTTIDLTLASFNTYLPAISQEVRLLQLNQQTDVAIARLQEQLALQPENSRLQLLYARLLTRADPNEAYSELTKLSDSAPEQKDIAFLRAVVGIEADKFDEAERILTQLLAEGYRPNTMNFYLGNIESARENNDAALNYYLRVGPSEEFISAQTIAGTLIANRDGLDAAHAHFEETRASSPRFRPQLYIAEANLLDRNGDKSRAIDVLSQALEQFPDNISLRYNRSTYFEQQDQLALMEDDLRYILNLDPDNASALNALGYVLTNKTDRHQEALLLIQRALELRPDDAAITDSMGWVLFRLGRYEESIRYLRKAFSLFPDPEVASHLGEVLWVSGEQEEAETIWRKTLQDNPDDRLIPATMRRFDLEP